MVPTSARRRGGYGGIGDDPCPCCGEAYEQFVDAGVDHVELPQAVDYCVLTEAHANYEPGVYVHEDVDGGGPA